MDLYFAPHLNRLVFVTPRYRVLWAFMPVRNWDGMDGIDRKKKIGPLHLVSVLVRIGTGWDACVDGMDLLP